MAALPDGTYEGVILSARTVRRGKLMFIFDILLTKTGERVEASAFAGRVPWVVIPAAEMKFQGWDAQVWFPNPDRSALLPILKIDLEFNPKFPDMNKLLRGKPTGERMASDIRHTTPRTDFIEF